MVSLALLLMMGQAPDFAGTDVYRDGEAGLPIRLAGGFRFLKRQETITILGSNETPGVVMIESGESFSSAELAEAARSGGKSEGVSLQHDGVALRLPLARGEGLAFPVQAEGEVLVNLNNLAASHLASDGVPVWALFNQTGELHGALARTASLCLLPRLARRAMRSTGSCSTDRRSGPPAPRAVPCFRWIFPTSPSRPHKAIRFRSSRKWSTLRAGFCGPSTRAPRAGLSASVRNRPRIWETSCARDEVEEARVVTLRFDSVRLWAIIGIPSDRFFLVKF